VTDTNDLLDEAIRLTNGDAPYTEEAIDRTLWDRHGKNDLLAERDEARGKLDEVRRLADEARRTGKRLSALEVADILDGKTGD